MHHCFYNSNLLIYLNLFRFLKSLGCKAVRVQVSSRVPRKFTRIIKAIKQCRGRREAVFLCLFFPFIILLISDSRNYCNHLAVCDAFLCPDIDCLSYAHDKSEIPFVSFLAFIQRLLNSLLLMAGGLRICCSFPNLEEEG